MKRKLALIVAMMSLCAIPVAGVSAKSGKLGYRFTADFCWILPDVGTSTITSISNSNWDAEAKTKAIAYSSKNKQEDSATKSSSRFVEGQTIYAQCFEGCDHFVLSYYYNNGYKSEKSKTYSSDGSTGDKFVDLY